MTAWAADGGVQFALPHRCLDLLPLGGGRAPGQRPVLLERPWRFLAVFLLAGAAACSPGDGESPDSARGAPPEPHDTANAAPARNPAAASATDSLRAAAPDPSAPWPADTFDVRIDRWSFEVPAEREKIPECRASTPVVTGDSIGPLRAGLTRSAVEAICPRLHFGWYYSDDQAWTPAATVRLGNAVLLLEFAGTGMEAPVTRLASIAPESKTAEGIGAGSTFAAAREAFGVPTLVPAKCAVFARWASKPGLIARIVLTDESGWECSSMRQVGERNQLTRVPSDSRIGYIAQEAAPPR